MMESVFYGVPMVAIPQYPEQAIHADNIAKLGLGVALNPDTITADILRETVEQVSSNQEFAERCRAMQAEVQQTGGYRRAVDAIMLGEGTCSF
jgi:UDP:flavonoid glycosyltransferase YjiC (YdhE family)